MAQCTRKEAVVKSILLALSLGLALAISAAAQDSTKAPPAATRRESTPFIQ